MKKLIPITKQYGFSLIELSIVLIIFGLLLSAILLPIKAQRDISKQLETEAILNNAKKALLGFAQSNGYLPCPADPTANIGTASPIGGGECNSPSGLLPGITLGIRPIDDAGYAIDAWNNRIRYSVSTANTSNDDFTTIGQMNVVGLSNLTPDLHVCLHAINISGGECGSQNSLIDNAVVVLISTGASGNQTSGGTDEAENLDGDNFYISHNFIANDATNGEFDHIVNWLSPYILYHAMIQAGQIR